MSKLLVRMPPRDKDNDELLIEDEAGVILAVATDAWEVFRFIELKGGCSVHDVDFENEAFCRLRGWMRSINAVINIGLDQIHKMMPDKRAEGTDT